jgi:hypothetical protein
MIHAELLTHLATRPRLEDLDAWVSAVAERERAIQGEAAWAAAEAALPVWTRCEELGAKAWRDNRVVMHVVRAVRERDGGAGVTELAGRVALLDAELALASAYVEESCSDYSLDARGLDAALAIYWGARAILWTPADVPETLDEAERTAQRAAGAHLETVRACRLAVFAIGPADGAQIVADAIRERLMVGPRRC